MTEQYFSTYANRDKGIYEGKGPAIIVCYEDETKVLYAGNDEIGYESVVNFCPFCGFESENEMNCNLPIE